MRQHGDRSTQTWCRKFIGKQKISDFFRNGMIYVPKKAYRWNNDRLETHYPDKFDLSCLTITFHWANAADDKMTIFFLFLLKIDFGISYKLCL